VVLRDEATEAALREHVAGRLAAYKVPKTIAVNSKYSIDITPDEQAKWEALRGQAQHLGDLTHG